MAVTVPLQVTERSAAQLEKQPAGTAVTVAGRVAFVSASQLAKA